MGIVYRAIDVRSGMPVAVKLLKPQLRNDRRAVQYFMREAHHVQCLNHPHILQVLEVCHDSRELAYMVMPYLSRGSLATQLDAKRPLATSSIIAVARQVGSALAFAHYSGIIHRDVKPANVLFDELNRAHLTDFGLCRSLFSDPMLDVRREQIEGTPQYQSPNTLRGRHEDTRGDIYSFGAVLYEMLTGYPPYLGRTRDDIVGQIELGPPVPILRRNPMANRRLARISERAMSLELDRRYAHMSYILSDLARVDDPESRPLERTVELLERVSCFALIGRFLAGFIS